MTNWPTSPGPSRLSFSSTSHSSVLGIAIPTLVVYLLSGKYFVRGLMAGSVKG